MAVFEDVKRGFVLAFKEDINVFIYRSDLITEDTKEKQINFEDVENNGKWFLLLDEAHKGDKEESKRQYIFSLISRNGFLFNFSATFIDIRDILTCVYEYNLATFTNNGFGKHLKVLHEDIVGFRENLYKKKISRTFKDSKKLIP